MPTIKPEIQRALRQAGFSSGKPDINQESTGSNSLDSVPENEKTILERKLETAGLSLDSTLENLYNIVNNAQKDSLKLRATETILKLHQVLKDTGPSLPQINIVIKDPDASAETREGVNPILLPREIHNKLNEEMLKGGNYAVRKIVQ